METRPIDRPVVSPDDPRLKRPRKEKDIKETEDSKLKEVVYVEERHDLVDLFW